MTPKSSYAERNICVFSSTSSLILNDNSRRRDVTHFQNVVSGETCTLMQSENRRFSSMSQNLHLTSHYTSVMKWKHKQYNRDEWINDSSIAHISCVINSPSVDLIYKVFIALTLKSNMSWSCGERIRNLTRANLSFALNFHLSALNHFLKSL